MPYFDGIIRESLATAGHPDRTGNLIHVFVAFRLQRAVIAARMSRQIRSACVMRREAVL